MSVSYNIGCKTCRVFLWIGQSGRIYTGEKHTMKALEKFLYDHRHSKVDYEKLDHELVYGEEWSCMYWGVDEDKEWKEIDSDDYKEKDTIDKGIE